MSRRCRNQSAAIVSCASSSSVTTTRQEARHVQFSEKDNTIHLIPNRSELNITRIWYNRADMLLMRPHAFEVENASGCSTKEGKNKGECMRGLEGLTKPGSLHRTTSVRSSVYAVLDEQRYGNDKDIIPELYSVATRQCQELAHIVGLVDELYVKEHVHQDDMTCSVDTIQSIAILKTRFGLTPLCTCHTHHPKQKHQHSGAPCLRASSFLLAGPSKKAGIRRMTTSRKFFPKKLLKGLTSRKHADEVDDDDTADSSCTFSASFEQKL